MNSNNENEIVLQIEVISKPKVIYPNFEIEPNLNKRTFFYVIKK